MHRIVSSGKTDFYPRPPRGGRHKSAGESTMGKRFLSTPSARRATLAELQNIMIRAISIHALREEGDLLCCLTAFSIYKFLSTPSARRATCVHVWNTVKKPIFLSTPSARRATRQLIRPPSRFSDFYPRPPRGGRPADPIFGISFSQFLSTPSARRATPVVQGTGGTPSISIHALREEGDLSLRSR